MIDLKISLNFVYELIRSLVNQYISKIFLMARGGKRPGSGRKKVAIEDNAQSAIREAVKNDPNALSDIWKQIVEKARKGSDRHAQLLFNYYYGKPKENEGSPTEMIINVLRNS